MEPKSLIPLVEGVVPIVEKTGESVRMMREPQDNSVGIFRPGAVDRATNIAEEMARQLDRQQEKMTGRKETLKARLGTPKTEEIEEEIEI